MKLPYIIDGKKMIWLLWNTVWQFLKVLNTELPYDTEISFLGVDPREMKTYIYIETCTQYSWQHYS